MRKLLLILAVLAAVAGAGFAAGKTLVYGTTEKMTNLDPAEAYDFHTWEIFYNVYQGLLNYAPGGTKLVPGMAESYTANAAGDEFTFKLRKGVKFTDGSPFNAEAVKWTIDRVMALEGPAFLAGHGLRGLGQRGGRQHGEVQAQVPLRLLRLPGGLPAVLPRQPEHLSRRTRSSGIPPR